MRLYITVAREVAAAKLRKEAEQKVEQKSDLQMDMSFPPKMMNGSDVGSFKRKDEELQEPNKKAKIDEKPKVLEKLKVQDKTRPVSSTPVEGTPW